jgi:hypothetical protein
VLAEFKHQVKPSFSPENFKKAYEVRMFQVLKKRIKARHGEKGNKKGRKIIDVDINYLPTPS